ncbi:MAG: mechanosensitive ion channel family protein [Candidatus Altiarchaeota archaeon]|nr:mechanosensitive ion channel family protein [Candidatus Altiarchaeota archaeon]
MNETITLFDTILNQVGIEKSQYSGYDSIIVFAAIVVASLIAAKIVYWIIERYVKIFAKKTKSEIDDLILRIIQKPLYYIIILLGFEFAVRTIELSAIIQETIATLVSAGIIAIGAWFIADIVDVILVGVVGKKIAAKTQTTADDEAIPFLSKVLRFTIYLLAFIIILDQFNIEITPLVASLGIAGFAIGFAAKDTIGNLLAGFFILMDRPFAKGDRIEIKGHVGEVVDIGLRTTRIETLDHTYVIIPNADIVSNELINYALPDVQLKVKINIGVAYGTDTKKVKEILLKIAKNVDDVMKEPTPAVFFTEFGDSALNFLLIFWVSDFRKKIFAIDEINTKMDEEFKKHGIEIPYPCRNVYIQKES